MRFSMIGVLAVMVATWGGVVHAAEPGLEGYVSSFDYDARRDMKVDSKGLIELLKAGEAQLVDIRFKEEFEAWRVHPAINIPLNELPERLDELDTGKTIVVACPHKDRATIAMVYLRANGIPAKYLTDGLTGLVENLRGDAAREFIRDLP